MKSCSCKSPSWQTWISSRQNCHKLEGSPVKPVHRYQKSTEERHSQSPSYVKSKVMLFRNHILNGNLICIISFSWEKRTLITLSRKTVNLDVGNRKQGWLKPWPRCSRSCFLFNWTYFTLLTQRYAAPKLLERLCKKKIYKEGAEVP